MSSKKIRNSLLLMVTALIWGIAFVAQSEGGDAVGPYSFNSIRSLIGGVVLLPVIFLLDQMKLTNRKPKTRNEKKTLIIGGISCGVLLFLGSTTQQLGLYYGTSAGKAGFLTACYILIVPILGLLLGKKCGWNIYISVLITLVGLYLLCMNGSFSLQSSDMLVLLSALFFSVQIMIIDHYAPLVDGVRLSCIQFFVSGIIGVIPMFFIEIFNTNTGIAIWSQSFTSWGAWIPILYAGIMSCGVAYTLQIIGQEGLNSTVASLLMSLESVFSVLAGWLLLKEHLSERELIGCLIIFVAIVLAQLPVKKRSRE